LQVSTIQPEGEALRKAVRFVSDALREDPDRAPGPLLDEAARRFDLDPLQADYLARFHAGARRRDPDGDRDGGGDGGAAQ
jgi:hypothetical protein